MDDEIDRKIDVTAKLFLLDQNTDNKHMTEPWLLNYIILLYYNLSRLNLLCDACLHADHNYAASYKFGLKIIIIQGVPINMGIQWQIQYRLFK